MSSTQSTAGDDQTNDWVTVFDAGSIEEASIIRGHLESEDIQVFLRVDSLSTLGMTLVGQGVKVQVPRYMEERAIEVLEAGRRPGRT